MNDQTIDRLFSFISQSPSSYHVVDSLRCELTTNGYQELSETEAWEIKRGGKYFVSRNGSSLISFRIPRLVPNRFRIIASHGDSPTFKVKPGRMLISDDGMTRLNVERYGEPISSTWFDRPLSIAGRVLIDAGEKICHKLIYLDKDFLMIPSLAIHLDRNRQPGPVLIQSELPPVFGSDGDELALPRLLASKLDIRMEQLLGMDLFLVNRQPPIRWGSRHEFIAAPRLDDLACCYSSFLGFLQSTDNESIPVHCTFDNEEVGSHTRQGAASGFLKNTLERITAGLQMSREDFHRIVANSFMVSADNAHAFHPNYPDRADPINRPYLNKGIVIKYHAEQKYATDGYSAAICKKMCRDHAIPYQEYTNHSDIRGGSTLGNISSAQLPLNTVDVGLPQFAMHSCYESAGAEDVDTMMNFSKVFFGSNFPVIA